jgi:5-formyltetrahydrofolate cyclo-ligase
MNDSIAALKAALRQEMRHQALRHAPDEQALASQALCARLRAQPVWAGARSVLFYSPLAHEPDVRPLLAEALAAGRFVALPRYVRGEDRYVACQVEHLTRDLARGYFGIVEPKPSCPEVSLRTIGLCLVPGIGFTMEGGRLGHGKGYYDRMLAEATGVKCGAAFDWQVGVEFPRAAHDIVLNCIVTPTRWLETGAQRRL